MGFLSFLSPSSAEAPALVRLPAGVFTVDRTGRVLVSTLASMFPAPLVSMIGEAVIGAFEDAAAMHQPLTELVIHYPSLKITARAMRGGALIFLLPVNLDTPAN